MNLFRKSSEGQLNGEQQLTEATATDSVSSLSTLPDSALSSGDSDIAACANKQLEIANPQLVERERIRQKLFESFPEQIKRSLENASHFRKLSVLVYEPILRDEQEPCCSKSRYDIQYRTIYIDLRLPMKQVLKSEWLFKLLSLDDESARALIIVQRGRVHKTIETHLSWCSQERNRKNRRCNLQKVTARSDPLTVGEVFDEQVDALHFVLNAPESFKRSYTMVALRETKRQSRKSFCETNESENGNITAINNELASTANNTLISDDTASALNAEQSLTRVPSRNIFSVINEEFTSGNLHSSLLYEEAPQMPTQNDNAVKEPPQNVDLTDVTPISSILDLCNDTCRTQTTVISECCQTKDVTYHETPLDSQEEQCSIVKGHRETDNPKAETDSVLNTTVSTNCQATEVEKAASAFSSICNSDFSAQPDPSDCWPSSHNTIELDTPSTTSFEQLFKRLSGSEPELAPISAYLGSTEVRILPCRVLLHKLETAEVERYMHSKSNPKQVNQNASKSTRMDVDAYTFSWLKPSNEIDLNKNSPKTTCLHLGVLPTPSVGESSPTLSCPLYFSSARNGQAGDSDADSYTTGCSVRSMVDHTELHCEPKHSRSRNYGSVSTKRLRMTQSNAINRQSMLKRARISNSTLHTSPSSESKLKLVDTSSQLAGSNYIRTARMRTRARSSLRITRSFSRHLTAAK